MPKKDGVLSLGFEYQKELSKIVTDIEKNLNSLSGNINISDEVKKQINEVKSNLSKMPNLFDKISGTKLDTKEFEKFENKITKQFSSIKSDINDLKKQLSTIDNISIVDNISKQFDNLETSIKNATTTITNFKKESYSVNKPVSLNVEDNSILKIREDITRLLSLISKEDFDFGYTNKSAKELSASLDILINKYYSIEDGIDNITDSMNNIDKGTQKYKEQELQLTKLKLELSNCAIEIDDLLGAINSDKIDWKSTFLNESDLIKLTDSVLKNIKNIKKEAEKVLNSIDISIGKTISVDNKKDSNTPKIDIAKNKISIPVELSTKQSTINKQLDEMIDFLQERASKKPVIAPVKLRVDSDYEKTQTQKKTGLTNNQINEARKDTENVIPGLEKAFSNSMRIATNKAVENAKDSIKSVREYFEKNPIAIHLNIPDSEKEKIENLTSDDININPSTKKGQLLGELISNLSGVIKDFSELKNIISSIQDNNNNDIFQKMSLSLDEVISKFDELIILTKDIGNSFNTAFDISSINNINNQWSAISDKFKTISDESGKINLNKQKKDIKELLELYQNYLNSGGTNSFDSLTDNSQTVEKLIKQFDKLNQVQKEDNNSIIKEESENLNSVTISVEDLTDAIGNRQIQAINESAMSMESAADRENIALKTILDNLDLIISKLNNIKDIKLPDFKVENINDIITATNSLNQIGNKITLSSDNLSSKNSNKEIQKYYKELEKLEIDYQKQREKLLIEGKKQEQDYYNSISKARQDYENNYLELLNSRDKDREKTLSSIEKAISTYESNYKKLYEVKKPSEQNDDYKNGLFEYRNSINEIIVLYDKLSNTEFITEEELNKLDSLKKKTNDCSDALKNMSKSDSGSSELSRDKLLNRIGDYLRKNTALSKEFKEEIKSLEERLKFRGANANVADLTDEFLKLQIRIREAGQEGKTLLDIIKNKAWYGLAAQIGTYFSFYDIIRYTGDAIRTIKDLDTALVDLQKTTTMSKNELNSFYKESPKVAKEMGVTTEEIINQASAWSRLGYSSNEQATKMAKLSSQFTAISPGMDLNTSTDGLVSSMKAFDIEVTDVQRDIMDNINRIGNTAATSNEEIVDMLTRSSAAMAAANNTIQETIALETAAVEITRNAETTGTAFKTKNCLYVQKCA